jgi:hypothetical protein
MLCLLGGGGAQATVVVEELYQSRLQATKRLMLPALLHTNNLSIDFLIHYVGVLEFDFGYS